MATLNLRISNNKNGKGKNMKPQKTIAILPKTCVEYLSAVKSGLNKNVYDKLFEYETVEEYLDILKKISHQINDEVNEENEDLVKIIVAMYFLSEYQCHSKNAALKSLEGLSIINLENIIIGELIKFISKSENSQEDQIQVSKTLLHFSKSKLSFNILKQCWDKIINFLSISLDTNYKILLSDEQLTPLQQSIIYSGLHTICQTIVTLFNKQGEIEIIAKNLVMLLTSSKIHLPIDTQNTCSIALVLTISNQDELNPLIWPALGILPPIKIPLYLEKLQNCTKIAIRISLCSALLSSSATEILINDLPEHMVALFGQASIIRCIFLFLISSTSSTDAQVLLGACRALELIGRLLKSKDNILNSKLYEQAIEYSLAHLEHHMDSVKHSAKEFFNFLLNVTSIGTDNESLIFNAVRSLHNDCKARFIAISSLAIRFGSYKILDEIPFVISWLLNSTNKYNTAPHAINTFEILISNHENIENEEWFKTWILPILYDMHNCKNLESVLAKAITIKPITLNLILNQQEISEVEDSEKLKILFDCLKVGQKCNILTNADTDTSWKNVITWDKLVYSMKHSDDVLRLSTIALLVESRKPTEPLNDKELVLLRIGLITSADSNSPDTIHRTLGLTKKLFTRLVGSLRGLKKRNDPWHHYTAFLDTLCTSLFKELFPGANYTRLSLILQIFSLIIENFSDKDPWKNTWELHKTKENAQILLDVLTDSYENNKLLSINIIKNFPSAILGFDDENRVDEIIKSCVSLSESYKPPDCITAAYVFSLLIHFPDCLNSIQKISNSKCTSVLAISKLLLNRIKHQLRIGEKSILKASVKAPMYGSLFCLRFILSSQNLLYLSKSEEGNEWNLLINELVDICFKLNSIALPIVNSSSPEGLLPVDDESDVTLKLKDLNVEDNTEEEEIKVTAQMVLLCSWRTVKEVSLLLGELSANAPASSECYLLTNQQLMTIGEHLTTLLCETKHRGAFEQSYVGFCRLCSWLWRVPSGELPQLPGKWLNELLLAISYNDNNQKGGQTLSQKLCATRRSAGVPFIVQALVTTELAVRERPECFPDAMSKLLELASLPSNPGQVHALNILRALFRSSVLAEHVAPYVSQGFFVAFKAFSGITWAERNAATLLFSALMGRVFGVKHTPGHEEYPRKNRMTGRIFFRLYPKLFSLISDEIKNASMLICSNISSLTPSLHPTLLLLSRLYPSSLEGTDSSLNLFSLRADVILCASSPVFHTRVLAAKALTCLIDPLLLHDFINSLSLKLPEKQNTLHGTLLQLTELVKLKTEINTELINAVENKIIEGLEIVNENNKCEITKYAFVDFIYYSLLYLPEAINCTTMCDIQDKLILILSTPGGIGYSILKQKCCQVLLEFNEKPTELLEIFLHHPVASVINEALIFLIKNSKNNNEICGDAPKILKLKNNKENIIRCTSNIAETLLNLANQCVYSDGQQFNVETRIALFLSVSRFANDILLTITDNDKEEKINEFLAANSNCVGDASFLLVAVIGEFIYNLPQVSEQLLNNYVNCLYENLVNNDWDSLSLTIAQSLIRNRDKLLSSNSENICKIYKIAMILLQDTNNEIRKVISQFSLCLSHVTQTKAMENLAVNLVKEIGYINPKAVLCTLIEWSIDNIINPTDGKIEHEEHEVVFDKTDTVFSSEQYKLTIAACEALKFYLDHSKGNTFERIQQCLNEPIKNKEDETMKSILNNLKYDEINNFLHNNYQISLLQKLQIKCLKSTGIFLYLK